MATSPARRFSSRRRAASTRFSRSGSSGTLGPGAGRRRWPVAIFCTYAVSPKATLPVMRGSFEARGAAVVAQAAFGPRELAVAGPFGPAAFVHQLIEQC